MEILLLRNPSIAFGCQLKEGETGKVSKELGRKLVALGLAVETEKPEKPAKAVEIKGVPDAPAIGKKPATKIAGDAKKESAPKKESAE